MKEERRTENKCPKCKEAIANIGGVIQCTRCEWKKDEERTPQPEELSQWKQDV
jgi:hypothetical protein